MNFIEGFGTFVNAKEVKEETKTDNTLRKVLKYVKTERPERTKKNKIKPYHIRRSEMTVKRVCLMWRFGVVIPEKLRGKILQVLHLGHLG